VAGLQQVVAGPIIGQMVARPVSVSDPGPIRKVQDSAGLGWTTLTAGIYREDAVAEEFETTAVPELLLVVVTSGSYRIESAKAGRWAGTTYHPGSVGVTAPGCSSVLRWTSTGSAPLESVQLRLPLDLLDQTRHELAAPAAVLPDVLSLDDAFVAATGAALGSAVRQRAPALYADTLARALAAHLVRPTGPAATSRPPHGLDPQTLRRVVDYMREHVADDPGLAELAAVANYSVFHFLRLFRESTGTTPHRYVVGLRMRRAAELLKRTDRPVTLIATDCGYRSPGQFSAAFRREFGCTPGTYRRTS
jgi:AraC family transcriptional regulator